MNHASTRGTEDARPPEPRPAGTLATRLEPALRLAGSLVGAARRLAVLSTLAAAWLIALLVFALGGLATGPRIALGMAIGGLLLAPPVLVFLFWLGLRELLDLPRRLIERADAGKEQALELVRTAAAPRSVMSRRGLGRIFGSVARLREILGESRLLLLQFSAVARLMNPAFFVALLVSVAACWVLILAALVTALIVAL